MNSSLGLERRSEICDSDVAASCLFEIVVRIRRLLCAGSRSWMRLLSCDMVVSAGKGRERVDGRLRPGKDVKKTLSVDEEAMACVLFLCRDLEEMVMVMFEGRAATCFAICNQAHGRT